MIIAISNHSQWYLFLMVEEREERHSIAVDDE